MNPVGTASLTDQDGNVRGARFVVIPGLPADTGIMFAAEAYRTALGPVQTMTADVPRLLGRDHAVFRFGAFLPIDPAGMGMFHTGAVAAAAAAKSSK